MDTFQLEIREITPTIDRLYNRINDRFPGSGLGNVCAHLHELSKETPQIVRQINKPHYGIRFLIAFIILVLVVGIAFSIMQCDWGIRKMTLANFVQLTEAALNELVIIGAGIIFMVTFETRHKRMRVVRAVNRLRSFAHIIDAHQLTKDPDRTAQISVPTTHSPKSTLSDYQLGRYLDYCSEMLSLVSKLGFLYVQNFHDPIANDAVNDLENLTNGLSRKIWQKIMILKTRKEE